MVRKFRVRKFSPAMQVVEEQNKLNTARINQISDRLGLNKLDSKNSYNIKSMSADKAFATTRDKVINLLQAQPHSGPVQNFVTFGLHNQNTTKNNSNHNQDVIIEEMQISKPIKVFDEEHKS